MDRGLGVCHRRMSWALDERGRTPEFPNLFGNSDQICWAEALRLRDIIPPLFAPHLEKR
jgi:hypothetical protein